MKILILNGSPKENSSTMTLTRAFLKGMKVDETDRVKEIQSFSKNIQFCRGDLSCWFRPDHQCVIQDDMNELLDDMTDSDYIIWSFPLYCHGMPASLKAILDRTIVFFDISMRAIGERIEHEKTFDLSSKKHIFIVSGGYPYYPGNFSGLKLQLQTYLGNPEILCICETPLLDVAEPSFNNVKNKLFIAIEQAGSELVEQGRISEKTIRKIEQPMISNEAYIKMICEIGASAQA